MSRVRARRRRGLFLSLEGVEGSGKSTQVRLLVEWLQGLGRDVVTVREPGGTALGESIRELLLRRDAESIDPRSELFLYMAARSQLVSCRIEPALASGKIVIADRFGDASVAYQGGGRRLGPARVRSLLRFATGGLTPDRTYLLDLPPSIGLSRVRARGRPDRLESERLTFHSAVRSAYRAIAAANPDRVRLLRASDPASRIAERIRRDLSPILDRFLGEGRLD